MSNVNRSYQIHKAKSSILNKYNNNLMMISISIGTVGIRVSGITVVGISVSITISMAITEGMSISMVGMSKGMTITIVSISSGLSSSSWLGISRPLAIISVSVSMVGI